jgi:hypothetical protein
VTELNSVHCGVWLTLDRQVWVDQAGKAILAGAEKLLQVFHLKAGSGVSVPKEIQDFQGLHPVVKSAVHKLLSRGYWSPRILSFNQGPKPGYELEVRPYSRLILQKYCPVKGQFVNQDEKFTENFCFYYWTPRQLNHLKASDFDQDDQILFGVAQALKARLCSPKAKRWLIRGGAIAKPIFKATTLTEFSPVYLIVMGQDAAELAKGETEIPRNAIVGDPSSEFDELRWLVHGAHNVLQIEDPAAVFPKFDLHSSNFPPEIRASDPVFFDEGF